jgi:hypothetical protein
VDLDTKVSPQAVTLQTKSLVCKCWVLLPQLPVGSRFTRTDAIGSTAIARDGLHAGPETGLGSDAELEDVTNGGFRRLIVRYE